LKRDLANQSLGSAALLVGKPSLTAHGGGRDEYYSEQAVAKTNALHVNVL
jgi:hypothetical protein